MDLEIHHWMLLPKNSQWVRAIIGTYHTYTIISYIYMYMYMYMYIYISIYICVCVYLHICTYIYIHVYLHIYIYICVCISTYLYIYILYIYMIRFFYRPHSPHDRDREETVMALPSGGQAQVVEAAGPADDDAEQSKGHRAKVFLDDGTL